MPHQIVPSGAFLGQVAHLPFKPLPLAHLAQSGELTAHWVPSGTVQVVTLSPLLQVDPTANAGQATAVKLSASVSLHWLASPVQV